MEVRAQLDFPKDDFDFREFQAKPPCLQAFQLRVKAILVHTFHGLLRASTIPAHHSNTFRYNELSCEHHCNDCHRKMDACSNPNALVGNRIQLTRQPFAQTLPALRLAMQVR